jgi:hypothetical protein
MFRPAVQQMTAACEALGWTGEVVGPVTFGGVQFWASVELDQSEHQRRLRVGELGHTDRSELERCLLTASQPGSQQSLRVPLRLIGVLVVGERPEVAVRAASYFAGYSRRAAVVPDDSITVDCVAVAAMIDVGVVTLAESGFPVPLLSCGPRARGACFNAREWHLLETVYVEMRRSKGEPAPPPLVSL